ncbi:MAG: hypothetical protein HQL23_01175 [Candidatus Omnitrophica bacterium]|nr:hypothetical protein [Candidatus Omnitrophota bacterium]
MEGLRNFIIRLGAIWLIWAGMLIIVPDWAFAYPGSFAPSSGKTLLMIGQDRDTISQYVRATGNIPGGTTSYTSIHKLEGLDVANEYGYGDGPKDGAALLNNYPNSVIQLGFYMVDELANTITGKYDANLRTLAQWIIKANRPVYLRIGYEFDFPVNHYDPQKYKQAFRYVVDFLRKEGVRNAAYIWHSECMPHSGQQWMDWYPGDDYADWFGVSLFSTQQIPTAVDFLKLAREHRKPFMICESTPQGLYTVRGKKDFLEHIFRFIRDQNIEAFCYINSNWDIKPMWQGQHWGDSRIEQYPEIKDLWLKEITQGRYLKASPDLFRSLGWQR